VGRGALSTMHRWLALFVLAATGCGGDGDPAAKFSGTQELGSRTRIEVTFESRGAELRGVLDLPSDAKGPHPAIVWLHGSGDERLDERSSFYTEHLDRRFAVFAYDKRTDAGLDFELLAEDAIAAVKAVRSHDEIDDDKVGFLALSQGGWIAPLAAAKSDAASFAVILSGSAVSLGEEDLFSDLTGSDGCAPTGIPEAEIQRRVNAEPPSRFDPRPYLADVEIPMLWIYGALDTSQPVAKDLRVLKGLKAEGKDFATVVFSKTNHELLVSETGTCWEGRRRLITPGFAQALNGWLREHVE
jgi:uncharacterized protein